VTCTVETKVTRQLEFLYTATLVLRDSEMSPSRCCAVGGEFPSGRQQQQHLMMTCCRVGEHRSFRGGGGHLSVGVSTTPVPARPVWPATAHDSVELVDVERTSVCYACAESTDSRSRRASIRPITAPSRCQHGMVHRSDR